MLKSMDASTTNTFISLKTLYLLLAIAGSIAPWYWILQDPNTLLDPMLFLQRAFANNIAITEATDLLISATVFFCFAWIELKRLGSSQWRLFLYVGLTFGIGLCCALPFFLYHREQRLERQAFRQV